MNNLFRSAFITFFPGVSFGALVYLLRTKIEYHHVNAAEAISVVPSLTVVLFFTFLFIVKRPRTDKNLKLYTALILLGFIISAIGYFLDLVQIDFIVVNIITLLGWLVYLFWYSKFTNRQDNAVLQVGRKLPELFFEDIDGLEKSSYSFLNNYSIYLFYRGNWCPLCTAQIKELSLQYQELSQLNAHTILVSPQPHTQTKKLANKFDVDFHFLVDVDNRVARQLDIIAEHGIPMGFEVLGYNSDTVMPTVVITDPGGEIIFTDLTDNYRLRPEPAMFLQIIRAHQNL